MDLQTLSQLFATTYNADPNIRKAAELQIRKIGGEEGMIAAILRIIAADTIDPATRQACSVWLKNRVHSSYSLEVARRADQTVIAESEREALRINILPLLAASPSRSISLQLANTLRTIVAHDFPTRWRGLVGEIKTLLTTSNVSLLHAGCLAALEAVRAFRFRQKSDILPAIVADLFPTLVTVATQMVQTPPSSSQEIPTMLHLILKTYRTSIIINLSDHQQSSENLVPWCQLFFGVVNIRLPKDCVPVDEDERQKCEWWKAKKWAYANLGRLFHRFGNASQLPSTLKSTYSNFAKNFVSSFAPEIFKVYLHQVELYISSQEWLSSKCQYQIFQYFTECVKPKTTWMLLKPHYESLVSNFVYPHLSFNEARKKLWEADPVDYVRISVDEHESYSTPVSAATTFLFSLVSNRTKTTFLPILGIINTVLRSHSPPEQRFGALNMTAALGPYIMRHPEVRNNMEHFMVQFVSPELSSQEPYLRAIALEILGTVTKNDHIWSSEELLSQHIQAVASALDDTEIPVKVQAVLTLTEMVIVYESVRKAVAPQVGKVIQDLLALSDETDLEILNNSLEAMAEQFQTELLPVAAQLTARLCDTFLRLAKESVLHEPVDENIDLETLVAEVDDDKCFAAMSISKTISTVVSSVDSSPEILAQLQEIIIPIIVFSLENRLLDLFNNMYELVDSLTFKLRSIAPSMWPVFELTYTLFKHEAVDFLEEMLPALDNFVSYGGDVIKSRPDYIDMLVDIYTESISNDQLGENDRVNGSKLAECLLLHLRGGIDHKLQLIINTALSILDDDHTSYLRLANLEVLINSVLYNPSAALHFMEVNKPGTARNFFDRWFAVITSLSDGLPRVHDKKLSILALCSLLEMPPDTVPEPLREGWPGIVGGILKIFKGLPKAIENRKELEIALQEDLDEEEESALNLVETDDDVWDDDSAYLELLAEQSARLRERAENKDTDEDVLSDESDLIEEELGFISPLDTVNPYTSFKQALTTFQMQNGLGYQASTTILDIEQQTMLMEIMRIAEQASGSLS